MTNKYEPVDLKDGDIETAVSACPDQKSPVATKVEDVTHTTTEHRCRKRPFLKGVFVGIFGTLLALKLHMMIRHCRHHHHHPGRFHDDLPPPPPLDIDFINIPEDYEMKGKEKMWDDKFMNIKLEKKQWDDEKMMKKKKMWHDKKMHGHHHEGHHHEGHHHGHHHGMKMHGHQKHMIDVDEPEVDMIVFEEELNAPEEKKEEGEEEIPVPSLAIMETNEAVEEVVRREESP